MKELTWRGPLYGARLSTPAIELAIPKGLAGLYVWRKIQRLDPDCVSSPETLLQWLNRGVESPLLRTTELRVGNPRGMGQLQLREKFVSIEGLSVGQGKLPDAKILALRAYAADAARALHIHNAIQEASMAFGPAMYVGESNCIRTRTIQHISDGSDLRLRIADLTLEIEDLALYYAETPNITLDTRRLLESVLTHILGAPLTYRAG